MAVARKQIANDSRPRGATEALPPKKTLPEKREQRMHVVLLLLECDIYPSIGTRTAQIQKILNDLTQR